MEAIEDSPHIEQVVPSLTSPSKRRKFITKLPKFPKLNTIIKPRTKTTPGMRGTPTT